jgi:hypothetical protein
LKKNIFSVTNVLWRQQRNILNTNTIQCSNLGFTKTLSNLAHTSRIQLNLTSISNSVNI